ncbi:MAG: transposase [Flavobacteriales bacterium]|nr:transposase [Flavobacteriales bacterium]
MKTNVRLIQKRRAFSEEFKRSIVKEFESGLLSVNQLGRLHKIDFQSIYKWIYKYSTVNEKGIRIVEKSQSSSQKLKDQEKRIAELERALGQKQMKIDYLEKMMELAKDELGIDVKKNSSTSQSAGSKTTKSN